MPMKPAILIFEDNLTQNFLPLTFLRPVYELRCGVFTIREKIEFHFKNHEIILHSRTYLTEVLQERNLGIKVNNFNSGELILINGRLAVDKVVVKEIKKLESGTLLMNNGQLIAGNVTPNQLKKYFNLIDTFELKPNHNLKVIEKDFSLLNYPWEIVNKNPELINIDLPQFLSNLKRNAKKFNSAEMKNKKNIHIAVGVEIDPFVFLDASAGPIIIDSGAKIMSHSAIQGPAFIGKNSIVKLHASIYHGTSVGEWCKVGGEIEASIIHSYSNKQHEGFLGHSYLGSWVNIGASTNNSDLKNNYSNITVLLNGKNVDTNSMFMGLIMGDHSKTAINTMFNTGTIVGVSCNIFGGGFPNRYLPSFCWGGSDFLRTYDIRKCIEVAEIVMKRRNVMLTESEISLLRTVFNMTKNDRSRRTGD